MVTSSARPAGDLPPVDARLVAEDCGHEILDGRLVEVPPAHEPHGERHSKINALLEAFVLEDHNVACDMLTRTSKTSDIAPDASVYPRARDPHTGGRQLEVLAFEIVSTQTLADAGGKARSLASRGVRRVFAVDVPHARVFEWSRDADDWQLMPDAGAIDDPCLVQPLPVPALAKAARADDAMAAALLAKRNPVIVEALEAGREQGRRAGGVEAARALLRSVAIARGLALTTDQLDRIDACDEVALLQTWATRAATASRADDVL
jgi:Uma2 family endonuclease